jgi:hypothetical protein
VWGLSDTEPQHWMPAIVWFLGMLIIFPLLLIVPVHFLLRRFMPKPLQAG